MADSHHSESEEDEIGLLRTEGGPDDHEHVPLDDINDAETSFADGVGLNAANTDSTLEKSAEQTSSEKRETTTNLRRLYVSHTLAAWGDRMWDFAIALFMIEIWPSSILMAAVYGLCSTATIVLLGPVAGNFVDTHPRLTSVRLSTFGQNLMVLVCMVAVIIVLGMDKTTLGPLFWVLIVIIVTTGAAADLFALLGTLAVEKDWVLVVCGADSQLLAHTNAVLRRIDLTCSVVAPLVVGVIMTYVSTTVSAIAIGSWNLALAFPEYILLIRVYGHYPALRQLKPAMLAERTRKSLLHEMFDQFAALSNGWRVYFRQEIALAALALAMLYCTVLSFHAIMTAYVFFRGLDEWILSLARGCAAVFGVAATFIFPPMHRNLGLVTTGQIASVIQLLALGLALASPFVTDTSQGNCDGAADHDACIQSRNLEIILLCVGVIISRVGLWLFDLAVSQMLQERVPEAMLATVNGVQGAMQSILDMFAFVLGIIFSAPGDWRILVVISVGFVFGAFVCYSIFAAADRRRAFHRLPSSASLEERGSVENRLSVSERGSVSADEEEKGREGVVQGRVSVEGVFEEPDENETSHVRLIGGEEDEGESDKGRNREGGAKLTN
eukprot:m.244934 g.244934  ORF g.244934 m.244934 type:complete len:611 (+) comp34197_c0_seq1:92-1924(+)